MNVFISYAREDFDSAERLYSDLSILPGITPWLDLKMLLPGVKWKREVMEALQTCDLCIILLSTKSVTKNGFIQKEISEALEKLQTFTPDQIFIIPARINDCHPKHPELNDLQWVDMFPNWQDGVDLIHKSINRLMGINIDSLSIPDDVIMETIGSAENFVRRLSVRGEMRGCDAMENVFEGLYLKGIDLSGTNFVRCLFISCDFQETNLTGVNFEGATLKGCELAGSNLWGVNFWGTDVSQSRGFDTAILSHTNFFFTKVNSEQEKFINQQSSCVQLGTYNNFIEYFSNEVGMSEEQIARTFTWLNHYYFRKMFSKNKYNDSRV
jgi:uncharacterized protein YjbI with pentapeptide repeats